MRRLILRPGAIGDCILALPALEHLVSDYTEIWAPSAIVPLIEFANVVRPLSCAGIDVIGIDDRPIPKSLFDHLQSFDSIVSWYGANRPEFQRALAATAVPTVFLRALPPPDYGGHATAFFSEQVGADADAIPRIAVMPKAMRDSAVMHPFSGSKKKNWPLARFTELAARLDCTVEWTAGPEEQLEGAKRFEDLGELASWISGARLYIGNDSGITHLAAAVGIPTLALFGPTDPNVWAPRGDNVTLLRADPIDELRVERVFETASRLLGL